MNIGNNHPIQQQLNIAKQICEQRKGRMTPLRMVLLKLIYQQNKPISAYDLLKLLKDLYPKAEAMTVYRGLEFWIEIGVLHKLTSNNTYTACVHPAQDHFGQLLLCQGCGKSTEVQDINLTTEIIKVAKKNQFSIRPQLVEIAGLCEDCHK